jgi:hypothetical protein
MGTMTCTNCFCDTGIDPDFGDMAKQKGGGAAIADLCAHWLCNDCLDQAEYEAELAAADAQTPSPNLSQGDTP